jgi:G3E family GTPase
LLHRHGERVLRVKGLLNVVGADTPVVVNGVQHLVHPPVHLARWPDAGRRSRIVFIVKDLERDVIEESLRVFNTL